MLILPFAKMHGLGNDFVALDARSQALPMTESRRRLIADRRLRMTGPWSESFRGEIDLASESGLRVVAPREAAHG